MKLDEHRQMYKRRLSEMLLSVIREMGVSGRELARLAGVNPGSMQNYLTGDSFPTKESREKIAHGIFGVSLEELDARIEDRPVQRQSKVDDICREIRLMSDEEFLEVFDEMSRQVLTRFRSAQTQASRKRLTS